MEIHYLVRRAAKLYPGYPAVTCGPTRFTVAEVYERACRLANALAASGCRRGDRVGVYLPNCAQYMEVELGLAIAGLVRASLNVRLPERDLLYTLEDAGVAALIYAGRFQTTVSALTAQLDGLQTVLCLAEEAGGALPGQLDYEQALARASTLPPAERVDPEALYSLFYTSGTTGRPKGVMLTHRAQAAVAFSLLLEFPVRPGEQILLLQPLSHGAGFFMLPYYLSGAHCVVHEKFDAAATIETAQRMGIETIKVVPTMLLQLLQVGIRPGDLPALRRMIYGASPMPAERLKESLDLFGPVLTQLYGQSEAPMCITVLSEQDHLVPPNSPVLASAGRPWRDVEVRVVDGEGRDVTPGVTGEVIVRGRHMMSGYWKKPEQTAEVMRGGYIYTRDMATVDERGFVYLLGRKDEMIISGGQNIAPRGVEEVLHQHPKVLEAAVVGVPDPKWGEAVKAFLVLQPGAAATPEEIIEYSRPLLGIQRPRYIEFLPELPKNAYGKILKTELKRIHQPR